MTSANVTVYVGSRYGGVVGLIAHCSVSDLCAVCNANCHCIRSVGGRARTRTHKRACKDLVSADGSSNNIYGATD